MESSSEPAIRFLNIEYFFRLIYEALNRPGGTDSLWAELLVLATQVWLLVTVVSIIITLGLLYIFVQSTLRYQRMKEVLAHSVATEHAAHAEEERDHSRWKHVRELIESPNENDWRQAIIEADIMLDDLLSQLGYVGQSVGEKLRAVDPARFQSLQYAWDAHKVRNEIAHSGSQFQLSEQLAHRTIAMYEVVMREHGEI